MTTKNTLIGYAAGITTGITYGLNPLFAMPLMKAGASVASILFFRYGLSVLLLGAFILFRKQHFNISCKQFFILLLLGLLYMASSICLFESYKYIPSGLATTLIFLYPVFVALIMVFLKVFPTWQVWLSIFITFIGVLIMTREDGSQSIQIEGVLLALGSAWAYAFFIVMVNKNKSIGQVSNTLLTFYALAVGTIVFLVKAITGEQTLMTGLEAPSTWLNLLGLSVLPTIISTTTLALSSRKIGATKASILGVFEPITAILVGALAFQEAITPSILVGIALSMAAVTFMIITSPQKSA